MPAAGGRDGRDGHRHEHAGARAAFLARLRRDAPRAPSRWRAPGFVPILFSFAQLPQRLLAFFTGSLAVPPPRLSEHHHRPARAGETARQRLGRRLSRRPAARYAPAVRTLPEFAGPVRPPAAVSD